MKIIIRYNVWLTQAAVDIKPVREEITDRHWTNNIAGRGIQPDLIAIERRARLPMINHQEHKSVDIRKRNGSRSPWNILTANYLHGADNFSIEHELPLDLQYGGSSDLTFPSQCSDVGSYPA